MIVVADTSAISNLNTTGLLEKLESLLNELISNAEFHVSTKVRSEFLLLAGEEEKLHDSRED